MTFKEHSHMQLSKGQRFDQQSFGINFTPCMLKKMAKFDLFIVMLVYF